MKRSPSSLGRRLLVCAAIGASERVVAQLIARDDLVSHLLVERSGGWLALLSALMVLRLSVLIVIPGWLAWSALAAVLRWRKRATERAAARAAAR